MYNKVLTSLLCVIIISLCNASYYDILGVSKQASTAEIKKAFKKLAIKLHPDKNSKEKEQKKFLKITEAYETLKDSEKRYQYDTYGSHYTYSRKYDYQSQSAYDNFYMNGLYHRDPYVQSITPSSYKTFLINFHGFHFINFYSPFCPPCQRLADDWKKLAEFYNGVVKVGAVNCKYYSSFCYHSMRIGNYPSLYFYPNGQQENYVQYTGPHTFEDLEKFVLTFIKSKVPFPYVNSIENNGKTITYVIDADKNENMFLRIGYRLYYITKMVRIDDDHRRILINDPEATVLFKYNNLSIWISSMDENTIVKEIVDSLPQFEQIGLKQMQDIRNELRNGGKTPYVLYFSTKGDNKLALYCLSSKISNMNFVQINCDKFGELCHSLHVNKAPAWGVLKLRGGYQRIFGEVTQYLLEKSAEASNLHSLSVSDFQNILEDDKRTWVLIIAPYDTSWHHMMVPFVEAALEFKKDDISFGIISCTKHTDENCRAVSGSNAIVAVQERGKLHRFSGEVEKDNFVEFVDLIKDIDDFNLNEEQVMEIGDVWSRENTWLVAFLPPHCVHCDQLMREMRIVSKRLRPLKFIRVGVLWCSKEHSNGLCNNVRFPTLRVYPLVSGRFYTMPLQQRSKAPYILEWAFKHIDDSIVKLTSHSFYSNIEQNAGNGKPWVVYFHSPRCYKCYEMYTDFAIVAHDLSNVINFGTVNCVSESNICRNEYIDFYPTLRIYLNKNKKHAFRAVVTLEVSPYLQLLNDIEPHVKDYNGEILARFQSFDMKSQYLRDEL